MKNRYVINSLMLAFIFCKVSYIQAQSDEIIIGAPQFDQNDIGLIYQDTTNGKVYSYVNSELGTKEIGFDFIVDSKSDILNKRIATGKQLLVNSTGAIYMVKSDSITRYPIDSCVVIPTKNGKYAILQPKDRGFYIEYFGAIPDDGIDDSQAIQNAINAAIKLPITSRINAGPGVFKLDKGVVAANKLSSGEYFNTTITISGAIPSYSKDSDAGSTTVFELVDSNSFCIAIHKGRNCLIENIVFLGVAEYPTTDAEIINWTDSQWEDSKMRLNSNSPSCAIVIDPFNEDIETEDQYSGFENYYTNSSNDGGTSLLTISGCSFDQHYIAIANNPSSGIQNGDNIRVQNSSVKRCHTFWACGQTQSRSNSIDNVYGINLHTFIDGLSIGNENGTAPTTTNINLAGITKNVLNVNSYFTPVRITKSYFENVWSLGVAGANSVSFDQCQIKFKKPSNDVFAPNFHLNAPTQCTFRDCSIEYFDNCETKAPIMFKTNGLVINGGWIEGGIIVSNGHTNTGGDLIHNVKYENVRLKCLDKTVGIPNYGVPLSNTKGIVLMAGDEISISKVPVKFINNSNYNFNHFLLEEDKFINIDSINKTAVIIGVNPGKYQLGDNIFTNVSSGGYRSPLGYVSAINNDTIIISSVPISFPEGTADVYSTSFPIFIQPIWGDFTSGSDTIKNIVTNQYPDVGTKIVNAAIPLGTYIKEKNTTEKYIIMSTLATANKTFSLFVNAPYKQEVYVNSYSWPLSNSYATPFILGAKILFSNPTSLSSYYGYICTKGGIENGGANTPEFKALTW